MLKCDHQFFQSKATEGTGNEHHILVMPVNNICNYIICRTAVITKVGDESIMKKSKLGGYFK